MRDDPKEYDKLPQEEKQAVQYWISKAIKPATKEASSSSYGLKHDYEHESGIYISNAEFKGAMLAAGYAPNNESGQNWLFNINKTYDNRRLPHDWDQRKEARQAPMFRIHLIGEPDEELTRLATIAKQVARDSQHKA